MGSILNIFGVSALRALPLWAKYVVDTGLVLAGLVVLLLVLALLFGRRPSKKQNRATLWSHLVYVIRDLHIAIRCFAAFLLTLLDLVLVVVLIVLIAQPPPNVRWSVDFEIKGKVHIGNFDATTTTIEARSSGGGKAKLAFVVVNAGVAFWPLGALDYPDWSKVDVFFKNSDVQNGMRASRALVCVGLASWKMDRHRDEEYQIGLSYKRARKFCEHLETILGDKRPSLYGFGLGRNQVPSTSVADDDAQRLLILIQVSDVFGDLRNESNRRKMIACLLYGDNDLGFYPGNYYVTEPHNHQTLRWFRIDNAASNGAAVEPLPPAQCDN